MEKLISIDLKAPFGFLKKPDINEGGGKQLYLTFNLLHKPALLGILGAIVGLSGYRKLKELPQYYRELNDLLVGIQPLNTSKGNFVKTIVHYKNGVGYASLEVGGNLIIAEQILIQPAFRCYFLLEMENSLHQKLDNYLRESQAEYLPYLGKNEFSLWWEGYFEHSAEPFSFDRNYRMVTIFRKGEQLVKEMREKSGNDGLFLFDSTTEPGFIYFEELPVGFDEKLMQYKREVFAYTNYTLRKDRRLDRVYYLKESNVVIQLF